MTTVNMPSVHPSIWICIYNYVQQSRSIIM